MSVLYFFLQWRRNKKNTMYSEMKNMRERERRERERERERANNKQKNRYSKMKKKSNYDGESKFCQRLKYILQSLTFQREDQNTAVLCSVERVSASTHLKEIITLKVLLNK